MLGSALGFLLVLARTTSLMMAAPVVGSRSVPARVRLGLAVAFTCALAPRALAQSGLPESPTLGFLITALFVELAIGTAAGLMARFSFAALEAAGAAAGIAMGLGFAMDESPFTEGAAGPLARFLSALGLLVAVWAGLLPLTAEWLARAFDAAPPGHGAVDLRALFEAVFVQAVGSVVIAVRVSFPILGAVTLGHVCLGLLGRTSPQLNLQSVGFSIAVLAGGAVLFTTAPTMADVVVTEVLEVFRA